MAYDPKCRRHLSTINSPTSIEWDATSTTWAHFKDKSIIPLLCSSSTAPPRDPSRIILIHLIVTRCLLYSFCGWSFTATAIAATTAFFFIHSARDLFTSFRLFIARFAIDSTQSTAHVHRSRSFCAPPETPLISFVLAKRFIHFMVLFFHTQPSSYQKEWENHLRIFLVESFTFNSLSMTMTSTPTQLFNSIVQSSAVQIWRLTFAFIRRRRRLAYVAHHLPFLDEITQLKDTRRPRYDSRWNANMCNWQNHFIYRISSGNECCAAAAMEAIPRYSYQNQMHKSF